MNPPPELEQAVLSRNGRRQGEEIRFRCPRPERHQHGDAKPSARYNPGKGVWYCDVCKAKGGWKNLSELLGVQVQRSGGGGNIVATYAYTDEHGALLFEVVRRANPKSFLQRRPDGKDGWIWNLEGVRRVLYRLPEILAAVDREQTVYIVEGEKDADNLARLGLAATTNAGGAGKWKASYSETLRGARVVLLPDNDTPGREHARKVAEVLHGIAAEVWIVELPNLPEGGDVSDWLAAGCATEAATELEHLVLGAAPWSPAAEARTEEQDSEATGSKETTEAVLGALEALPPNPKPEALEPLLRELAESLRGVDALEQALAREQALRALDGKVSAPARLLDSALRTAQPSASASQSQSGTAMTFDDPEPWPEPVAGTEVLSALEETLERHVALPSGAAVALALWVLFTYCHEGVAVSPLLALVSPEKRSGKTTTLSLLGGLVRRPLPASNITPAALFRSVEKFQPTLLIDEADTFLREREELRGILNSGHSRANAYVVRTVGEDHEPRCFSTWAPKAIALIGRLPSTLEDRSIVVAMKRKAPGEVVEPLRVDRLGCFEDLRRKLHRWATEHAAALKAADPKIPPSLHDRAADNWRPLLAIADLAGGDWPRRAREAAEVLSEGATGSDSSVRVQLLADVREIFHGRRAERLFTEELLQQLRDNEAKPWGEWRRGKPLSAIGLARLLKGFGITPRKIRIGQETRQGYLLDFFEDAFARYLPAEPEHPEQVNDDGPSGRSTSRNSGNGVPGWQEAGNPLQTGIVPGVPARHPESEVLEPPPGTDREVFDL